MTTLVRHGMWILAVLTVTGPALAELPIPGNPLWKPVRDDDFMRLDGGSHGMSVSDPSGFLDAYWMARYYGMILPPEVNDDRLPAVEKRGLQLGAKPYDGPPRPDLGL